MAEKKQKNEVMEDLMNIGLVFGGVVVGNLIDRGATKILKLDANVPLSGIAEMKKFISPAVRIIGGGAGAYLVPNKMARLVLGGVAVSGAVSMVDYGMNKVLKKPQVEGIGTTDIDTYYEDVVEEPELELPELTGGEQRETKKIEPVLQVHKTEEELNENEEFDDAEII